MRFDSFGARLQQARLGARLSRGALADRVDVEPERVCEWEDGRARAGAYEVRLLAKALGVSVAWLTDAKRQPAVTVEEVIRRG